MPIVEISEQELSHPPKIKVEEISPEDLAAPKKIREVRPPWAARYPYLAAIPPTAFGMVTEAVPYAKYLRPEERERFWESSPEQQRLELLREARDAVLFAGFPGLLKGAGAVVKGLAPKLAARVEQIAKTHLWGRRPPTITSKVEPPIEIEKPSGLPTTGESVKVPPTFTAPPIFFRQLMPKLTPHFTRDESRRLIKWMNEHPDEMLVKIVIGRKAPLPPATVEALKQQLLAFPPPPPPPPLRKPPKIPPKPSGEQPSSLSPPMSQPPSGPVKSESLIATPAIAAEEVTQGKFTNLAKDIILSPFRGLTAIANSRLTKSVEMLANKLLIPEQVLSREPAGQQLVNLTKNHFWWWRQQKNKFLARGADVFKGNQLKSEDADILTSLVDYANREVQPIAEALFKQTGSISPQVHQLLRQRVFNVIDQFRDTYPPNILKAAKEHIIKVTDPIWTLAKASDPEIGYQYGYITHFPLQTRIRELQEEIAVLTKRLTDAVGKTAVDLESQLGKLKGELSKFTKIENLYMKHLGDTVKGVRYKQLPNGKMYGPLDEARNLSSQLGFELNYTNIVPRYIEGALRKVSLDRYMPRAKALLDQITDPALKQVAFNYISAQRGALSAESNLYIAKALDELGLKEGQKLFREGVGFATRLHYLGKVGLSWIKFPLVNLAQKGNIYAKVGEELFIKGMAKMANPAGGFAHARNIARLAKRFNIISEEESRLSIRELESLASKTKSTLTRIEDFITFPARYSEISNRLDAFSIGLDQAKALGIKSLHRQIRHAYNELVVGTQWIYHPEAQMMAIQHPLGPLVLQFRSYSSNMINFLTKALRQRDYPTFARALGVLAVTAGSAAIPFSLWDHTRRGVLRNTGRDIGTFNPIEWGTERFGNFLGLENMGVELGTSFEWLNIPSRIEDIAGPTISPILRVGFEATKRPEDITPTLKRVGESIAPPITRILKGKPVHMEKSGRFIGIRRPLEKFYLQRPLEALRYHYVDLIANAMAYQMKATSPADIQRGEFQVERLIDEARQKGLVMDGTDLAQATRRAGELAGIYEERRELRKEIELP